MKCEENALTQPLLPLAVSQEREFANFQIFSYILIKSDDSAKLFLSVTLSCFANVVLLCM